MFYFVYVISVFSLLNLKMSQPYLFYSERCPYSKQIIETLKGLNKAGLYKFVLVESLARESIPPFLKKVPTLYIPEKKEVIVGKDIFGYISKPTNSRTELPTKDEKGIPTGSSLPSEISAWGFEGTGKLSEAFSSWDNPSLFSTNEGTSLYSFVSGIQTNVGEPTKSENTTKSKTGANDDVSSRLEALQQQRKKEFSGISRT